MVAKGNQSILIPVVMKQSFPSPPASRNGQAKTPAQDLELVWIRCKGYRCMGYRNSEGKWMNFYTHKKLTDFIEVIG